MKTRICTLSFVIFFLISLKPSITVYATQQLEPVVGKFTGDGLRLTIKPTDNHSLITIISLEIVYCNNFTEIFYPAPHVSFREEGWVYFTSMPMKSVKIIYIDPYFDPEIDPNPIIATSISRNCNNKEVPPNLICKNVSLMPTFHRSIAEPISFKSNHQIVTAGIRLPGVDGLIWVDTIIWNHGLRREPNLAYDDQANKWSGKFPSINIPVGDYKDVWLLVFDEFGQQAACKIGKLTVLP